MKLSMDTGSLTKKIDNMTALRMIKDAGFDAVDWSFFAFLTEEDDLICGDYRDKAKNIREYMDKIGISCNQAHAEMKYSHNDAMSLESESYMRMVRSLEVASILGASNIIIHPVASALSEGMSYLGFSREYFRSFIPYCEKFNIHISVENMFTAKNGKIVGIEDYTTTREHIEFVESIGSPWFNICLDVGHCNAVGINPPESSIRQIGGGLLKALHVHDNDGRLDRHLLPYLGSINWDRVTEALKDISYEGDFTFEACGMYYEIPTELMPYVLKLQAETGRELIKKIKN